MIEKLRLGRIDIEEGMGAEDIIEVITDYVKSAKGRNMIHRIVKGV